MKIKLWKRADGSFWTTESFNLKHKLQNETEDEFIERVCAKLKTHNPELFTDLESESIVDSSELPAGGRDKWRDQGGKINIDSSVKTKNEKNEEDRSSVKQKLKDLGLSEDQIRVLVK